MAVPTETQAERENKPTLHPFFTSHPLPLSLLVCMCLFVSFVPHAQRKCDRRPLRGSRHTDKGGRDGFFFFFEFSRSSAHALPHPRAHTPTHCSLHLCTHTFTHNHTRSSFHTFPFLLLSPSFELGMGWFTGVLFCRKVKWRTAQCCSMLKIP